MVVSDTIAPARRPRSPAGSRRSRMRPAIRDRMAVGGTARLLHGFSATDRAGVADRVVARARDLRPSDPPPTQAVSFDVHTLGEQPRGEFGGHLGPILGRGL